MPSDWSVWMLFVTFRTSRTAVGLPLLTCESAVCHSRRKASKFLPANERYSSGVMTDVGPTRLMISLVWSVL